MPFNPHIIPKRTNDQGAASAIVDLRRAARSIQSQAGVVGDGATVTGAAFTTADSGQRCYMQGPDAFGGPGFFATDPSGVVAIAIVPGEGVILTTGNNSWNKLEWATGLTIDGAIGVFAGGGSDNNMALVVEAAGGATGFTTLNLVAHHGGGGGAVQILMSDGTTTRNVVLLNALGNAVWPQSIGMWSTVPPTSQPAHPTTLADVITILTNYGLCA